MITKVLRGGYIAKVDDADADLLLSCAWQPRESKLADGRLVVHVARSVGPKRTSVYIHHFIIGLPPEGCRIDHIDGDGLNNCRSNLRIATHSQNAFAQRIRSDNTSGHKGVSWDKESRKWYASIAFNGKRIKLGRYATIQEAVAVYQQKADELFGDFAKRNPIALNSPNSRPTGHDESNPPRFWCHRVQP